MHRARNGQPHRPLPISLRLARAYGKELVVTSYLDHPLGQACAAWTAARLGVKTAGLLTHSVYEPNLFSASILARGPRLAFSPGTGFGWDKELASLEWESL